MTSLALVSQPFHVCREAEQNMMMQLWLFAGKLYWTYSSKLYVVGLLMVNQPIVPRPKRTATINQGFVILCDASNMIELMLVAIIKFTLAKLADEQASVYSIAAGTQQQ